MRSPLKSKFWRSPLIPQVSNAIALKFKFCRSPLTSQVSNAIVLKLKFRRSPLIWLFRILYAGFAGLNEFSKLSALSYGSKMFITNIRIQNPIEPLIFTSFSAIASEARAKGTEM